MPPSCPTPGNVDLAGAGTYATNPPFTNMFTATKSVVRDTMPIPLPLPFPPEVVPPLPLPPAVVPPLPPSPDVGPSLALPPDIMAPLSTPPPLPPVPVAPRSSPAPPAAPELPELPDMVSPLPGSLLLALPDTAPPGAAAGLVAPAPSGPPPVPPAAGSPGTAPVLLEPLLVLTLIGPSEAESAHEPKQAADRASHANRKSLFFTIGANGRTTSVPSKRLDVAELVLQNRAVLVQFSIRSVRTTRRIYGNANCSKNGKIVFGTRKSPGRQGDGTPSLGSHPRTPYTWCSRHRD